MNRVVRAKICDKTHLLTEDDRVIIVDNLAGYNTEGWWWFELTGGPIHYLVRRSIIAGD